MDTQDTKTEEACNISVRIFKEKRVPVHSSKS